MVTYRTKGGHFFLSSSLSNIFQKMLASFRRKIYLCIRLAALGNLKANFHCAHWHNLCIRLAALGNLKANFHCAHRHNLCNREK